MLGQNSIADSRQCDESKPSCGRCVSSGFTCTYSTIAPALEVAYSGVFQVDLSLSSRGTPPLISKVIPLMTSEGGGVTTYQMRPYEVAAIDRYLHRTVNTFLVKRDNDKEKAVDIANSVSGFWQHLSPSSSTNRLLLSP